MHPLLDNQATAPLDLAVVRSLVRSGGTAFAMDMMRLFVQNVGTRLEAIHAAAAAGDASLMGNSAHTLASGAGTIGAVALEAAARRLESAGKDGLLAEATTLVPALEAAADDACRAVETLSRAGGPALLPVVVMLSDDASERTSVAAALGDAYDVIVADGWDDALALVAYDRPEAVFVGTQDRAEQARAGRAEWRAALRELPPDDLPWIVLGASAAEGSDGGMLTAVKSVAELRASVDGLASVRPGRR